MVGAPRPADAEPSMISRPTGLRAGLASLPPHPLRLCRVRLLPSSLSHMPMSPSDLVVRGAGVLLLVAAVYLSWLGYGVPSWPQVRGTVTALKAVDIVGDDGYSWTMRRLQYTYEVSRKRYTSRRVRFGLGHWRFSQVYQTHAATLAVGQGVTVWHHPRWRWLCTLQPRGTPGSTVLIRLGVLYVLFLLVVNG